MPRNITKHGQAAEATCGRGMKNSKNEKQDEYLHEIKKGSSFPANERHFKEGVECSLAAIFSQNEKVDISCRYHSSSTMQLFVNFSFYASNYLNLNISRETMNCLLNQFS